MTTAAVPETPPQAIPVAAVPPAPAPEAATPPAPPPERELYLITVSMLRRYPLRCLAYLAGVLGLFGLAAYSNTQEQPMLALVLLAAGTLVTVRFVYWWVRMHNTSMLVTSRKLMLQSGVFIRQATDFPLHDVNDI